MRILLTILFITCQAFGEDCIFSLVTHRGAPGDIDMGKTGVWVCRDDGRLSIVVFHRDRRQGPVALSEYDARALLSIIDRQELEDRSYAEDIERSLRSEIDGMEGVMTFLDGLDQELVVEHGRTKIRIRTWNLVSKVNFGRADPTVGKLAAILDEVARIWGMRTLRSG